MQNLFQGNWDIGIKKSIEKPLMDIDDRYIDRYIDRWMGKKIDW